MVTSLNDIFQYQSQCDKQKSITLIVNVQFSNTKAHIASRSSFFDSTIEFLNLSYANKSLQEFTKIANESGRKTLG